MVFIGSAGGPDAILFYNSWLDFGAADIPLVGQLLLRRRGVPARGRREGARRARASRYWAEGRDSEEVRAFVEAYEKKHDEIPSLYAAGSYLMAQIIAETLSETGGTVDEPFIETAAGLTFDDSVYGPIEFDDYNNVVGNVYLTEVTERDDGALLERARGDFEDAEPVLEHGAGRVPRAAGLLAGPHRQSK